MNVSALEDDPQNPSPASSSLLDSAKRSAAAWAIGVFAVLVLVVFWLAIDVLLLVFAGLLFGVFLLGLSRLLTRYTPLGAKWALALVILSLFGAAAAGASLLAPRLASQVATMQTALPKSIDRVQTQLQNYEWGRWLLKRAPEPSQLMPRRDDVIARMTGIVSGTLGILGYGVLIFFIGLFFAAQPGVYLDGIVKLAPLQKRLRVREALTAAGDALTWWLVGKLISMAIIGVLTGLGLWLLGIKLAISLAVLAAVLTFIPNFGPIIAAVPAVLIGLLESPMTAMSIIALYLAIQTIESYLITPLIQQRTVSLPPALTITTQLLMGVLAGGMGLALATPLTAAALVLVRMLYVEDLLGDEPGRMSAS